MTRKIGDKLTDKNGLRVKIVAETSTPTNCFGCFYDNNDCVFGDDHPLAFDKKFRLDCFHGFIFVEDK